MFVAHPLSSGGKWMSHANEKFLERGLGRSLFSKRSSPDYFFESELV